MDTENPRHPLLKILLLDIGVAGTSIFGAFGIIIIIFIALNYFNILSLSELYPKFLSFLPRKESNQISTKPINIQPTISIPVSSFPEIARNLFYEFASRNLAPDISPNPSTTVFTQDSIDKNTFSYFWQTKDGTVSATFALSPIAIKEISYIYISLPLPDAPSEPTASLAQNTTSQFFLAKTQKDWKCKPIYKIIYCESFWKETAGIKKGLNVSGPIVFKNGKTGLLIGLCEYHKDSTLYLSNSCTTEFAKTGL